MENLKYQILLTSVWWNDDYLDVRRFSSRSEQEAYFGIDSEEAFEKAPKVNFQINNSLKARVVFKAPNTSEPFDVLNTNYCIIKDTRPLVTKKFLYYFIEDIKQDSAFQYVIDIKLDVFQTFLLDIQIGKGLVERAHLNRFKYNESNPSLYFDFSPKSPLLIRENANFNEKNLIERASLIPPYYIVKSGVKVFLGKWFSENCEGWRFLFIEPDKTYKAYDVYSDSVSRDINLDRFFENGISAPKLCICAPILKNGKKIILKFTDYPTLDVELTDYDSFLKLNSGYSYVYSEQLLPINPLFHNAINRNIEDLSSYFDIDSDGNLNIIMAAVGIPAANTSLLIYPNNFMNIPLVGAGGTSGEDPKHYCYLAFTKLTYPYDRFDVKNIKKQKLRTVSADSDYQWEFLDNIDIALEHISRNSQRNINLNPKLWNIDYSEIRLNVAQQGVASFGRSQLVSYFYSYATPPVTYFEIKSSLVPEVQTFDLSPISSDFFEEEFRNYKAPWGAVINSDFSLPTLNSQYEAYIANNKNFWLQNKIGYLTGFAQDLAKGQKIKAFAELGISALQEEMRYDNMKNAPEIYSPGSGTVSYALNFDPINYYLDYYEAPRFILERDDDYMYLYGFLYGKIDDFENVVNIRTWFNYVRGNFEAISGDISDSARKEIKERLNIGVRFWNTERNNFNFDKENLENWVVELQEE